MIREIDERDFSLKFWFDDDGRLDLGLNRATAACAEGCSRPLEGVDIAVPLSAWRLDDTDSDASILYTPDGTDAATETSDGEIPPPPYIDSPMISPKQSDKTTRIDIIMLAVGPLSEVLPFISIAQSLGSLNENHVRLATHPEHKDVIERKGVEFFDLGGEAEEMIWSLSADHPRQAVTKEGIQKWRASMTDILPRTWKACIEPSKDGTPFVADAIIATPLAFSHVHCAEKLGVPLHLMTTNPWTPTGNYPHPLTRLGDSYAFANRASFAAVEIFTWQQLGDVVNHFRDDVLELEPLELMLAPGLLHRLGVPVTYISPLIPERAGDWPKHVGFSHLQEGGDVTSSAILQSLGLDRARYPAGQRSLAAWGIKGDSRLISSVVAFTLVSRNEVEAKELRLHRAYDWDLARRPHDPLTGLASATSEAVKGILGGATAGPREAYRLATTKKESSAAAALDGNPSRSYSSVVVSAGKGIGQTMVAGLKTPVTFPHGLARGFHNAPRLYGDTTVREPHSITGWKSGMVAAGKGFSHGLYDGLTGFVTQPVQGAQREGPIGFLKGFGKGVGGLVLKPAAGACGVPGYAFMGLYKEIQKVGRTSVNDLIATARLARGELEWEKMDEAEREDIVGRWKEGQQHL